MKYSIYIKQLSLLGELRLGFDLNSCPEFAMQLQNIKGGLYSDIFRVWHIPYYDNHLIYLQKKFGHLAIFYDLDSGLESSEKSTLEIKPKAYPVPEAFYQQMRLKRYSDNTQKTYASVLGKFLGYWCNTQPEQISEQQIREYMLYLVDKVQCSSAYQRQLINALKLFYHAVINKPLSDMAVTAPRRQKVLPVVLSEGEVICLLSQVSNLKHQAMLYCIYSAGLRRNEVLELKVADIDSARNCIMVRDAKGNKDRVTLLSKKCLQMLRDYYRALAASKITKKASLHTLRHYLRRTF
jgi:integrase/recombinase XerD